MKIPSRSRSYGVQFNLTPMIDIVFLLIIFFLVASYLSSTENSETIQLSPAQGGRYDGTESPRRIIVTVTSEKVFLLNGKAATIAEIATQLRAGEKVAAKNDLEVRLRVDKRVTYDTVEPLMVECVKAGISKIQFNVIPESGRP